MITIIQRNCVLKTWYIMSLQVLKQFWRADWSKLCLVCNDDLVWPLFTAIYLSKQTQINTCVCVVWKSTTELFIEKEYDWNITFKTGAINNQLIRQTAKGPMKKSKPQSVRERRPFQKPFFHLFRRSWCKVM